MESREDCMSLSNNFCYGVARQRTADLDDVQYERISSVIQTSIIPNTRVSLEAENVYDNDSCCFDENYAYITLNPSSRQQVTTTQEILEFKEEAELIVLGSLNDQNTFTNSNLIVHGNATNGPPKLRAGKKPRKMKKRTAQLLKLIDFILALSSVVTILLSVTVITYCSVSLKMKTKGDKTTTEWNSSRQFHSVEINNLTEGD